MKRILAFVLVLAMMFGLMGCMIGKEEAAEEEPTTVPTTVPPTEPPRKVIHVLLPGDTEGWLAAAAAGARAEAEALQAAGNFDVNITVYTTAEEQIRLLEEIAAQSPKDGTHGVVMMPVPVQAAVTDDQSAEPVEDPTAKLEAALAALVEANVAYALADWVPEAASAASVANVCYDQRQIGAAAAAYLVEKGLTQKKRVVIIQGMSEEEAARTEGFKLYLQGKMEVNGKTIQKAWTSLSNIVYSDMQGTTKDSAETYFDTYMESKDHADTKYIAAWDDVYVLGVMEALEGETIASKIKKTFLKGKPVVASCGGSQVMLDLLAGKSEYSNLKSFGGIQTMAYSQDLLKLALQAMAAYFGDTVVEQDQTQPITWITAENASQYQGY